jgi:hypothetical protein
MRVPNPTTTTVFDKLGYEENRTVVGAVLGGIYWRIYLNGILPPGANDVMVILKNDCGQTYTYQLDGVDSAFVGFGDLHDNKYDDLASPIATFHGYGGKNGKEGLATCTYTVQAFPSQAFEHVYLTTDPLHYALSLAAVFIFTSMVFISYDYAVERRQQVVLRSALQSGAIVTSLFPEQVRDRLYEEQERQNNVDPSHDVTNKNNQEAPTINSPSKAIASLWIWLALQSGALPALRPMCLICSSRPTATLTLSPRDAESSKSRRSVIAVSICHCGCLYTSPGCT